MNTQPRPGSSPALQPETTLAPMIRKLELWKKLDPQEREAVLGLPFTIKSILGGQYLVRERAQTEQSCLLLSGYAFRQKLAVDGGRSISALHMKGDMVDLQNSLLGYADHSVQALGHVTVAFIPREAIVDLAFRMPNVGMAMWYDTLVDGSIFREWILNIARRDARSRIAHLICEFGVRLEALGLGRRCSYDFPMTQEQVGDATGLTAVHVNRSLMALDASGLTSRQGRSIEVSDWRALQKAADFDDAYLHLK